MKNLTESSRSIFARFDFAVLVFLSLLVYLPYFSKAYLPAHDGMYVLQIFYVFYNSWFTAGELTQWLPFYPYGIAANHEQLIGLTPVSYLFMLLGWILRIKDVLFLFKLSFLFEFWVMLSGVYLVARTVYKNRLTVFLVCFTLIYLKEWTQQIFYDFRLFYMFPWVLFCLLRFFEKRRPEYFWYAAILTLSWVMGNSLYCLCLWIFVFFIIFAVLWRGEPKALKCLTERSGKNVLLFVGTLCIGGALLLYLKDFIAHVDFISRSPDGKNSLGMFLTWGGIYNLGEFVRDQFMSVTTRYIGLWTILFSTVALLNERSRKFFVFLVPLVALVWLSFGGIFSVLAYHFPGMNYYRHIGLTYRFVGLLMIFCAGFGWENFQRSDLSKTVKNFLIIIGIYVFLLDSFRIPGDWFTQEYLRAGNLSAVTVNLAFEDWRFRLVLYVFALFTILLGIAAAKIAGKEKIWEGKIRTGSQIIFVVIAFAEMVSFQSYIHKITHQIPQDYQKLVHTFRVEPLQYQPERTQEPAGQRRSAAWNLIHHPDSGTKYGVAHDFAQFDQCHSMHRIDLYSSGFSKMTQSRKQIDRDLFKVLGCFTPKIRVMSSAKYAENNEQAFALMRSMPAIGDTLVLSGIPADLREKAGSAAWQAAPDSVRVNKFTMNQVRLEADVARPKGAWLVYADSYHSGWRADVNGRPAQVFPAYAAFKAVYLPAGHSKVHLYFQHIPTLVLGWFIVFFGLAVASILTLIFGKLILGQWRS